MYQVGKLSKISEKIVNVAYECLCEGIKTVKPGNRLGDIGHAIQTYAEDNYFSVVKEYCGHGIVMSHTHGVDNERRHDVYHRTND